MNDPQPSDAHLRVHPLLSQLLAAGAQARAFRGYVGPEKDSARMRLYPSLGDLSFFVEFDKDDIVASTAAPESLLPHGGAVVWLKPDAEVRCHGDQIRTVTARRPQQDAGGDVGRADRGLTPTAAGRLVQVQTGRVNIRLRPRVMSSCASCTCSSCQTHPSCTSTCNQIGTPVIVAGP
jgi:hypothetical protein